MNARQSCWSSCLFSPQHKVDMSRARSRRPSGPHSRLSTLVLRTGWGGSPPTDDTWCRWFCGTLARSCQYDQGDRTGQTVFQPHVEGLLQIQEVGGPPTSRRCPAYVVPFRLPPLDDWLPTTLCLIGIIDTAPKQWRYRTIDIDNGRRSEQWEHSRTWTFKMNSSLLFCCIVLFMFVYMLYCCRFYCVYLNVNCGNVQSGVGVVMT